MLNLIILLLCAQEQQAAAFSGGVPAVKVHAVPEGVEGVGDVGLVLVGFLGRVTTQSYSK